MGQSRKLQPSSGLQILPPSASGVSTQMPYVPAATERSFFGGLDSEAPRPTPVTWPQPLRTLQMGMKPAPDIETLQLRGLARIVGYAMRVDAATSVTQGTDAAIRNFQSFWLARRRDGRHGWSVYLAGQLMRAAEQWRASAIAGRSQ